MKSITQVMQNLVKPYIDNNDKAYAANIAPVEVSPAEAAHTAGTQLIYNGVLYDVTADIAINDDLATEGAGANISAADKVTEQIAAISSDVQTLKGQVSDLEDFCATDSSVTSKAYAPIVSFADGMPVNAVDVKVKIEPVQAGSGTPSPDNVRAISGWDAVNVSALGENLQPLIFQTGDITGVGPTIRISTPLASSVLVKKGVTYTVSIKSQPTPTVDTPEYGFAVVLTDKNNTVKKYVRNNITSSSISFTAEDSDDGTFIRVVYGKNIGDGSGYVAAITIDDVKGQNPQINIGSSALPYEPYNGKSVSIDLGGTRYGGVLDVTTGVLTVDRAIMDLGSLTWAYASATTGFAANSPSDTITPKSGGDENAICTCYERMSFAASNPDGTFTINDSTLSSSPTISVKDSRYNDAAAFTTAVTGQKFVYTLKTPTTVQLTPREAQLLLGTNNVFADSGDVSVDYYAEEVGNLMAAVGAVQEQANKVGESDLGTYNVPVVMGAAQNSYVRGGIIYLDKTAKHKVTLNSVKQFADSTDYTSQFDVDYSNAGYAVIYSATTALAGALMNVNVTVS